MKKGYVFTVDALFAILILTISVVVLLSQFGKAQTDYYTDRMAADVISVLSHTRTSELCSTGAGCSCPNYPKLETAVCDPSIRNRDASILELYSEILQTGALSGRVIEESIHEIFIEKQLIDEDRFGLALLYGTSTTGAPLELYNTDTYIP